MECLNNYIGLNGCGTTAPESGLFVNDLAGIELRQVNEIANENQQNYVGVWNQVQTRSLAIFEKDLKNKLRKKAALKGITQNLNLGKKIDSTNTKAASNQLRGITIELNDENVDSVDSNFQVIDIQKISIYVANGKTFDLKIIDLDTEEVLFNESQTSTALGWLEVNINDYYLNSRRIFIGYDCSTIDSVELDLTKMRVNCFDKCKSRVRGAYSDTATPSDITYDELNAQGLSVIFSVQCKYDVLVCNNKSLFAQSLLYLLASELLIEQVYSSRTTRWTLLDNKQAKELSSYYKALYKGGILNEEEYIGELNEAVELINLDQFDCCIECSGALRFQDSLI